MRRMPLPASFLPALLALALGACDEDGPRSKAPDSTSAAELPPQDLASLPPFPPPRSALAPTSAASAAGGSGPRALAHVVTAVRLDAQQGGGALLTVELDPPLSAGAGATAAGALPSPAPTVTVEALGPSVPGETSSPPPVAHTVAWRDLRTLEVRWPTAPPPLTRLTARIALPGAGAGAKPDAGSGELVASATWRPLTVTSPLHAHDWMRNYPQILPDTTQIPLVFSEAVSGRVLQASLSVRATQHENPAYPGVVDLAQATPLTFRLEPAPLPTPPKHALKEALKESNNSQDAASAEKTVTDVAPSDPGRSWYVVPDGGLPPGRLVHVTVAGALLSPGAGQTEAEPWTLSVFGPRPLELTGVNCDPECTPLATWHANFSEALHPETQADCLRIYPASAISDFNVWGHGASFRLARAKPGTVVRVTATAACRPQHGQRGELRRHDVPVVQPAPSLRMASGLRTLAAKPSGEAPALPLVVVGATRAHVAQTRLSTTDLPALMTRLATVLGSSADAADYAELSASAGRTLSVRGAMNAPQKLNVRLEGLREGRGWVLVHASLPEAEDVDGAAAGALVQVTELALTVKSGGAGTTVHVGSLVDGLPVAGARVSFFNERGQKLGEGLTPADGTLQTGFPTGGQDGTRGVRWVVAERDGDVALLDRNDGLATMARWRFDLPIDWDQSGRHLAGLVFTERGIYRPGETAHAKAYLLAQGDGVPEVLAGTPLKVVVRNGEGQEIVDTTLTTGPFGDLSFDIPLAEAAASGAWSIQVASPPGGGGPGGTGSSGASLDPDVTLSGTFRVESYRTPTATTRVEALEATAERFAATVSGRYYFGAPMGNMPFRWSLHRSEDRTIPAGHPDYVFGEAASHGWEAAEDVASRELGRGSGTFDAAGLARIEAPLVLAAEGESDDPAFATRAWALTLELEAQDADGQASSARRTIRLAPPEIVPGIRLTQGFVAAGSETMAEVIAVAGPSDAVTGADGAGAARPDGAADSAPSTGLSGMNAAAMRPGVEVTVELVHRSWTSTREEDATGAPHWHTVHQDTVVATQKVRSGEAATPVRLKPKAAGHHLVRARVAGPSGRVAVSEATLWVAGEEASWPERDDGQVLVTATASQSRVGEMARFIVQSPFPRARAWVTVETNRVLSQRTFEVQGHAPVFEVPVTAEMAPNAWVGVMLVPSDGTPAEGAATGTTDGEPAEEDLGEEAPPPAAPEEGLLDDAPAEGEDGGWGEEDGGLEGSGWTEEDIAAVAEASPRFGYARLTVSRAERALSVTVSPERGTARPGERVKVGVLVRDAVGQPVAGQVTFMAVDEAVLSLTGYRTPDVHAALSAERGLGVETSDLRLAFLAGLEEEVGMKGAWGGGGETGVSTRYRSRFATTATFLPAVEVGPDGRAEVSVDLPDNLTTFRLMAVAATKDGRYGRGEGAVVAQKPLNLRPGLPRFLTTGDAVSFQAIAQALGLTAPTAVTVTAGVSGSGALSGPAKAELNLTDATPRTATFGLTAGPAGEASVSLAARDASGALEDAVKLDLPVRHHAAARHDSLSGVLRGAAAGTQHTAWRLALPGDTAADLGVLRISVENTRLGSLRPALKYLADYPYGCVEQTTSMLWPLVALQAAGVATHALGLDEAGVQARIQAGVDRLLAMQRFSGGLAYWPDGESEHPWGSAYAAHALHLAARVPGVVIHPLALERLRTYLGHLVSPPAWDAHAAARIDLEARALAAWVLMRKTPRPAAGAAPGSAATPPAAASMTTPGAAGPGGATPSGAVPAVPTIPGLAAALGADPGSPDGGDGGAAALPSAAPVFAAGTPAPEAALTALIDATPPDKAPTAVLALLALASAADPRPESLTRARTLLAAAASRATVSGSLATVPEGLARPMTSARTDAALLALAVAALSPDSGLLSQLHEGLVAQQRQGRWGNTVENALATVALAGSMQQDLTGGAWVAEVHLGDAVVLEAKMPGDSVSGATVEIPMAQLRAHQGKALSFVRRGTAGQLHFALHLVSYPRERETVPLDAGFRVTRRYVHADGPRAGLTATTFRVGDLVRAHLTVEVPETRHYVAVDDPLPAGLEPILLTERPAGFEAERWLARFDRTEQRDDRVLLFAGELPTGRHEHSYLLRATTPGTFTAVGSHAHAMYSPHVEGRGVPTTVTVTPPP
jgi:uncharacterized protein YfaS (alpha-2-macroglobulin family)